MPHLSTSFDDDDIDVLAEHDAAGHLQLLAVGLDFESMRWIFQVSRTIDSRVHTRGRILRGSLDGSLASLSDREFARGIRLFVRPTSREVNDDINGVIVGLYLTR